MLLTQSMNGTLVSMDSYRSLDAWKHAHAAVILVHQSTESLTQSKYWAILDQLRRAVISVETNIVEGYALKSQAQLDRKSTRLNSSHVSISYAVFCLKKKKHNHKDKNDNSHSLPLICAPIIAHPNLLHG